MSGASRPASPRSPLRAGEFDIATEDYRTISGRDPLTIAQIIERHASEMPLRTI